MFRTAVLALLVIATATAHAESPEAWPVRVNVAMPFGYTAGHDTLHGFTWGFRAAAHAYPHRRGFAIGAYSEVLMDAVPHAMFTLGASLSAPVVDADGLALRVGGYEGARWSGEANDSRTRLVLGLQTSIEVPFYLYDLRIGARVESSFDDFALTATTIVVDVDLMAVVGLVGLAVRK